MAIGPVLGDNEHYFPSPDLETTFKNVQIKIMILPHRGIKTNFLLEYIY
jgi:hypothetical protein